MSSRPDDLPSEIGVLSSIASAQEPPAEVAAVAIGGSRLPLLHVVQSRRTIMLPPQLRHNGPGAFGRCLAAIISERRILSGCDNLLSHTAISTGHQLLAIMATVEEVESDSGVGFFVSAVGVGWHFFCRRCVRDVEARG